MRTIRIIEHISLDGVIQAPGGPEEDASHEFDHGGWSLTTGSDQDAAKRAFEAMLKMGKIDIATIKAATETT